MEIPSAAVVKESRTGTNTPLALFSLLMGGLTIGMTEFLMMGVLPDVSRAMDISIPTAGHLISIYALGVVVGAPIIVGITSQMSPKKVLLTLLFLMALFNGFFAMAPNYPMMLLTRFLAGLPHGAFFGIGAVVAARLAPPGREARAVSMMFAGLTVANIIGVPIGTYLGHHFSWRISFAVIVAVALLTMGLIQMWLPALAHASTQTFLKSLRVFKQAGFWLVIGISSIGCGGLFAWISYIAPLMTEVGGFQSGSVTYIMIIAGLGMAFGNIVGGRLADRFSPLKTTAALLVGMILVLLLNTLLIHYQPAALLMTFLTGAVGFALIAPLQMVIIAEAEGSEMLASAVLQATANIGNALGAFLGGLPIAAGLGYSSAEYVGASLAACGFGFSLILMRLVRRA